MPKNPQHPSDEPAPGDERPQGDLIRTNRYSLTNVLVIGGTRGRRAEVARAFHRESPVQGGSFVSLDCAVDEDSIRAGVQGWTQTATEEPVTNPLSLAEHGTLFLDSVERLSISTQRLLLALARWLLGEPVSFDGTVGPGRLVVGNP